MICVTKQIYFSPVPGPLVVKAVARTFTHVLNVHSYEQREYSACFDQKTVVFHHIPMTDEGDMLQQAELAADF